MSGSIDMEREIGAGLECGDTLPAGWYSDAAVFQAEKKRIFSRLWQYVGHTGQVEKTGDFFTTQLGDVPVIVVRDGAGQLRALANVCRHRGSEVVLECAGSRQTLQCHYHGWTYNLDGTLRAAPRANEQASFDKNALSLVAFPIESWGPLIFVNPDPAAQPLGELLGPLPEIFTRAGIDVRGLRLFRRDVYSLAANWKIVIENFNECYHCPVAHPRFSEVIDTDAYRVDTDHEFFSIYYGPYLRERGQGVTYATLWPTAMFALSDNPPSMQVLCVRPIDAEHTYETIDYYFAGGATEEYINGYVELSDLVQREDVILCESVQRGLKSGVVKRGRLMLSRERGIQHFQKLLYRAVAGSES
jgi:phenylpropionate dioxygenase-like ring-hydroxylating dioxygenase large terminal subunit